METIRQLFSRVQDYYTQNPSRFIIGLAGQIAFWMVVYFLYKKYWNKKEGFTGLQTAVQGKVKNCPKDDEFCVSGN